MSGGDRKVLEAIGHRAVKRGETTADWLAWRKLYQLGAGMRLEAVLVDVGYQT